MKDLLPTKKNNCEGVGEAYYYSTSLLDVAEVITAVWDIKIK